MNDRVLAYLVSLGIIGAGVIWIVAGTYSATSELCIAIGLLTIAVGWISISWSSFATGYIRDAAQDSGRPHYRGCRLRTDTRTLFVRFGAGRVLRACLLRLGSGCASRTDSDSVLTGRGCVLRTASASI